MANETTYTGSCHCGRVKFEVTAEISKAGACNCSICGRTGWLMTSVAPDKFALREGADALTDYQFGRKTMHHTFCSTCGIRPFGRYGAGAEEKVVVNLRCLDGLDADALEVQRYDGRSW